MPGRIPREFIDDLIARIDLVDLIDVRVPLKKTGANYKACCPFHTEKTPSFNVNREKQYYHCFGCGASGNAISFLMDYERQSFTEAVESLAESLGVTVPRESSQHERQDHDQGIRALYDLQGAVALFYARQLREHPEARRAVDYLKARGVSGEIAKKYLLGYAQPGWRGLPSSFPLEQLQAAGLVVAKEQGGGYDRFRDRIMFPIRDRRGRVVGFGGRVIDQGAPKYLNSPETPVFKKHREVYGLYEMLETMRKPERILVVEGYMDVIALAQNGIPYTVATLGTATSSEHVDLLFRYADELVFCFDGDNAGQNAAWKALEASLPGLRDGRRIRFMILPASHDPDSLVREEGAVKFAERLANAAPFSDYFFQRLGQQLDLRTIEGRAMLVESAKPLIEKLPAGVFRELMQSRLKELSGHEQVKFAEKSAKLLFRHKQPASGKRSRPSALRVVLALLLQNPDFFRLIDPETRMHLEGFDRAGGLVRKLLALLDERRGISSGGILERFRGEPEEGQVKTLSAWETLVPPEGAEAEFSDALKQFCRQRAAERLELLFGREVNGGLTQAEREEMRRLLREK
jgi:DNA primase